MTEPDTLCAFTDQETRDALDYLVRRLQMRETYHGLTGMSSDALVLAAFTGDGPWITDYPRDRSDWRRCLLAYALAPDRLRERMRPTMRAYRARLDRKHWRWGLPFPRPHLAQEFTRA